MFYFLVVRGFNLWVFVCNLYWYLYDDGHKTLLLYFNFDKLLDFHVLGIDDVGNLFDLDETVYNSFTYYLDWYLVYFDGCFKWLGILWLL